MLSLETLRLGLRSDTVERFALGGGGLSAAGGGAAGGGRGDARGARTPTGSRRRVFAVLVLACFVAFFLTQRLKHTPTAVQRFKLTPSSRRRRRAHIKAGADLVQARAVPTR